MKAPARHPRTCRVCGGTGWQPGTPIITTAEGRTHVYDTVEPCQHHWSNDDPTVDDYGLDRTEPITFDQYMTRLEARIRRGDPTAIVELDGWEHATHILGDTP